MTTRTKIGVCAGLLALAVGVMLVRSSRAKPPVEVRFVRYADERTAVLNLTNRGQSRTSFLALDALLLSTDQPPRLAFFVDLMPGSSTQLVVRPRSSERSWPTGLFATVSVRCVQLPSERRRWIEAVLNKAGINIASKGFVTTVDLPPRAAAAPLLP